ncbi:MAG: glycosyltransferase family 2 protein [Halomonas sp.]|nr:glycosyltransferase family A protein [Halomonas sp.]TVP45507.1 MAG: glycosyltransferase family 2 protein [Halomonas sp.]
MLNAELSKEISRSVSVIITTYNDDEEILRNAVASIFKQTRFPEELIVVDDGSIEDTSQKVLDDFTGIPGVNAILLKKENGGPSSARNYGLARATSDYVTFLDSDDVMLPDNLQQKFNQLSMLPDEYFGVYGTYLKMPENKVHVYKDHDGLANPDEVGKANGIPGGVHTYLFRKSALESVGGFDESLVHNEDFDLIIRMIKRGLLCKGSQGTGFIRNYEENSLTRSDAYYKTYNSVANFLDKAEEFDYFSALELRRRRKYNELRLAKRIGKYGGSKKSMFQHLAKGFAILPPENKKEWLAYFFLKLNINGLFYK